MMMLLCIVMIVGGSAAYFILDRAADAEMKKSPVDDDAYFRYCSWSTGALIVAAAGFIGAILYFTYGW